jgi:hypothetical protein
VGDAVFVKLGVQAMVRILAVYGNKTTESQSTREDERTENYYYPGGIY